MHLLATIVIALTILSNASAGMGNDDDMIPCEKLLEMFDVWYKEANNCSKIVNAASMVLTTSTRLGKPSSRIINLYGYSPDGFTFHTNKHSRKAKELRRNPHGSLLVYWAPICKMVRLEGKVRRVESNGTMDETTPEPRTVHDEYSHYKGLKEKCGEKLQDDWSLYSMKPTLIEFTEVEGDINNSTSHLYTKVPFHDKMWRECR